MIPYSGASTAPRVSTKVGRPIREIVETHRAPMTNPAAPVMIPAVRKLMRAGLTLLSEYAGGMKFATT